MGDTAEELLLFDRRVIAGGGRLFHIVVIRF